MPLQLRQFETLVDPVTSPSGEWALRYDRDGRAVIANQHGAVTWTAGATGQLRLELEGAFVVHEGVWRSDFPDLGHTSFRVTDEGDGVMWNGIGLPSYSLLHGPIDPVSLGDRAPVAEISGNRFLESDNGRRTVTRTPDGDLLHTKKMGMGAAWSLGVSAHEVETLDQPGTWLTWKFLEDDGYGTWELVLVDRADEVLWVLGRGRATKPRPAVPEVPAEDGDYSAWLETGLAINGGYCVTVIHDVDPDEALRRFGAGDSEISTATWPELLRRASYEEVEVGWRVVAAFALGPHTLLVEDNGYEGVNRPDLSRGTFAVSSYCSINADANFLVSRDGETLAEFQENAPSWVEGADPGVLTAALSEMGIDDPEAFDQDDANFLADLELLCRLAGIRPVVRDVTGPARVAILPARIPSQVAGL